MKSLACLICATVVALAPAAPASARLIDKDFHETFDVSEGVTLRLYHGDGDVVVTPWDQDVIDVEVRYHADVTTVGFGTEPGFDVDFETRGDEIIVRGKEGSSSGVFLFHSIREYEYVYTIHAPAYVVLDFNGDDGDVRISGWLADVECDLDDGDVYLSDVSADRVRVSMEDGDAHLEGIEATLTFIGDDGDVTVMGGAFQLCRLELEDGDVRVADGRGSFEIAVDDGDVSLNRITADIVDVRGEDGDVDLDLLEADKIHVNVSLDDGDSIVRLARGLNFEYLVTMDDGDVSVDLEGVTDAETSEHRVSGVVGDGGGLVRVSTGDGDVTLISGS